MPGTFASERAAGLFILGRGERQLLGVAGDREKGGGRERGGEETARACTGSAVRSQRSARGPAATLHYQEHELSQARRNRKGKAQKDRQGAFPEVQLPNSS